LSSEGSGLSSYVEGLFAPEDALLEEIRRESERQGLPAISISAEVGRLLQVLLAANGADRVLEIGTLSGYSAIWMARALPDHGYLLTLEVDPGRAQLARSFVERAGLAHRVDVQIGDATALLPELERAGERFDAIFIDADKESYEAYLDHALALVRPGGLIMADNAFWSGRVLEPEPDEEGTRAVQRFNRRLADDERLLATVVPIRDGLAVAVVR
jgi:caffeoyl-CoA O-methyltransferase